MSNLPPGCTIDDCDRAMGAVEPCRHPKRARTSECGDVICGKCGETLASSVDEGDDR